MIEPHTDLPNSEDPISQEEWDTCLQVLRKLIHNPGSALDEMVLKGLVAKMYKQARKKSKKEISSSIKAHDLSLKAQTYMFQRNDEANPVLPSLNSVNLPRESPKLIKSHRCYICKGEFREIHFLYHQLCPVCAELNYAKRTQTAELSGQTALITGGRIKIGFEVGMSLLRSGATLVVTTRFPEDAVRRYSAAPDFEEWKERLHVYGLDLRNLKSVEKFIQWMEIQFSSLEILINNAAQTVKRPLEYYQHLLEGEKQNYLLEANASSADIISVNPFFPQGKLDKDQQQIDLRPENSWIAKLDEVGLLEMLEVQLVNTTAPFMLNSQLKSMMERSPFERKFIVNVSAMEGQFNKAFKSVYHPHTNMAKAALNMMTRTSGADYAESQIYMTSVDTGWITDENPEPKKQRMRAAGFVAPLDITDGAARILDPIYSGINRPETPFFGIFLKDYHPINW